MIQGPFVLPPQLEGEGFPWAERIYSWNMHTPWPAYYKAFELELGWWWDGRERDTLDAKQYLAKIYSDHTKAWAWLESRFLILSVPRFDTEGDAVLTFVRPDEPQGYARVWAKSRFVCGTLRTRSTRCS